MDQQHRTLEATLSSFTLAAFEQVGHPCTVASIGGIQADSFQWRVTKLGTNEKCFLSGISKTAQGQASEHLAIFEAGISVLAGMLAPGIAKDGVRFEELTTSTIQFRAILCVHLPDAPEFFAIAIDEESLAWITANVKFVPEEGPAPRSLLNTLLEVELPVSIRLASRDALLNEVLQWGPGAVVEFDAGLSDPVEVLVNKRVVAIGSVVLVDGNYGIRVTDVLTEQRLPERLSAQ